MIQRLTLAALLAALLPLAATASESRALPLKKPVAPPEGAVALCETYRFACAEGTGAEIGMTALLTIRDINRRANRQIAPLTDAEQYGLPEVWALPTEAGGDCEDYVLWKKRALIEAGIAPDRLLIATVLDRKRVSHAVLIVRTGGADLVLDNLTDDILTWQQTGYTFLRVQDPTAPERWVTSFAGGILG